LRETNDAEEIFNKLIEQAVKEMGQPEGSTFTTAPMMEVIPPWEPSPERDAILNGTYQPPTECPQLVKDFLLKLQKDTTQKFALK